ncbi:hypothetical protein NQ314_000415 [Rhamnusium bicolor]|uniref:Uncharacterized protein n=1 Tax=Rhamnusium bicolor TaxID=1586634 RepID=A0AAV8ZUQ4_9CUCU|nr:hypothetical protein NQ314_000415 [Rhamnusium bicolor]
MKLFLVFLVGLFALVLSNDGKKQYKVANKEFLEKQKRIMQLFKHINQPSHDKEHIEIAKTWSFGEKTDHYTKPEAVKQFIQYWKYGFIPKGEIFSVFHHEHLEQAIALFKIFYYAKDFETFYKTAVWARQNVNEGIFLYSFSVAIVHRPDTYGIILPPIYEVYPHYFYNSETIHTAYYYKQTHRDQHTDQEHGDKAYTIDANYSGHYLNLHPEQSMSYFIEDVGINAFYYYYNLYYPFWMCGKTYGIEKDNRGEIFYYVYQQIVARYYLERLSNDWGETPFINWDVPIETPYYPSLEYPNGLEFPTRPAYAKLHEYFYNYGQRWTTKGPYGYSHSFIHDYERRINDAIDKGHVHDHDGKKIDLTTYEGFNVLGNIIEGNHDSPNKKYYGTIQTFARHLLGYSYQPLDKYHTVPSALEHFETSMRDPAFYQFFKKIVMKFQRYQQYVPPYTEKDLVFPGVKITKVEVDRLVTYQDYFYSDLSNAVYDSDHELEHDTFHIRARQERLNHKPFTYKVTVKSDKDAKASIKIFLGPKYDEYGRYINISENRLNMVELDHFVYDIKSGENIITRHSQETNVYGPDRTSYTDLWKQINEAHKGQKEFHIDGKQSYFYFPQRYMLPKGSPEGKTYQIYVIVYPYEQYKGKDQEIGEYYYPKVGTGAIHVDGYPLGYPFDRFIKFEKLWKQIPNSYFYEAKIYHKHSDEINSSHH